MKVALLRVGVDAGSGGIQAPLLRDGGFEYIPIPDRHAVSGRTYGNLTGRHGRTLADYFPRSRQSAMRECVVHRDPEFETNTYGDLLTGAKSGLRHLQQGDLLVFYCGLEGWDFASPPALYLMGYLEVVKAGRAVEFGDLELRRDFANNAHLDYIDKRQSLWEASLLVKGGPGSRLLNRPVCISVPGVSKTGRPLKMLSPEMQKVFSTFAGKVCIQRSPTRWVEPAFVQSAAAFVRGLE